MALRSGDLLQGRYRVHAQIGRGGMGRVFVVDDLRFGEKLALKQLETDSPELLSAFRNEFALLCGVAHPHLVRVRDFGAERVRDVLLHYYVSEWIDGNTLGEVARQHSTPDLLTPLLDATEGLCALHELGVRHGDVTPQNILVRSDGRGVLVDLGCARPIGARDGEVAGTPGFIAPELLESGVGDARSDLFGLGACLRAVFTTRGLALPTKLRRLVERLENRDPALRPSDAYEVLEALGRERSRATVLTAKARKLVGRERELDRFERWLETIVSGARGARVLSLTGPQGIGASRLIAEFVWRAELHAAVWCAYREQESCVAKLLARAVGSEDTPRTLHAAIAAIRELEARDTPTMLVVEDYEELEPSERELLNRVARMLEETSRVAVIVSSRAALSLPNVERIELGPLDLPALQSWTRGAYSTRRLAAIHAFTGGFPEYIETTLSELASGSLRESELVESSRWSLGRQRAARAWEKLSLRGREQVALFVALGGELELSEWGCERAEFAVLEELGFAQHQTGRMSVVRRADLASLREQIAEPEIRRAHQRIASALKKRPLDPVQRDSKLVFHLTLANQSKRAEELFLAAHDEFSQAPQRVVNDLLPLCERTLEPEVLLALSALFVRADEPGRALRAVARLVRGRPNGDFDVRARLVAVDAYLRLGRGARAERQLSILRAKAESEKDPNVLERLARTRIQRGDYQAAAAFAREGLATAADPPLQAALHESLGVASSYLGDERTAEEHLATAWERLGSLPAARERCRLLSYRAINAFRAGKLTAAIAHYENALSIAESNGLEDLIAVGCLNLGTAQQQAGDLGAALMAYERGLELSRAIGRQSTEMTLSYNLANLYAEIGAFDRAGTALERLVSRAEAQRLEHFAGAIAILRAELALAVMDLAGAERELTSASSTFAAQGRPRELCEVEIRRAELRILSGELESAKLTAERAVLSAQTEGADDLYVGAQLARARVALALSESSVLEELNLALERTRRSGQKFLEAQVESVYAAAFTARSEPTRALEHAERARRIWDRAASGLSAALREVFWRHPRRVQFAELTRSHAVRAQVGDREGSREAALRRLLSVNRRINSTLSTEKVLDYAVDAAIELTLAERGFVLLSAAEGDSESFEIAVARPVGDANQLSAAERPSRGIVQQVLNTESPILTTDARSDERFALRGSVHALKLKSVLCVPISAPSGVLGVLYLENRVQRGLFSEFDVELLSAFADQLAIALRNAALHRELEHRAAELQEQKRAIERLSRGQARELERLQQEVELQRRALGLRYDYSQIAGRGPTMRALLSKLDRIVDAPVNVLVQGESGTGKELIARAVHFNGPRKDRPFVGVNCAALPEALLESELFGHVRGAFTGADRDKEGLFQTARGGTLFLDELGEMPLSIQAKLLRVLQEREVRPVGSTRALPLDVRLICATNRDLRAEVAANRFREDLFYRVSVVELTLPPLRERREDIPEIASAILRRVAQQSGRQAPELTPDALRQIMQHAWPGNVRELENALTRAMVLCDGRRIVARDLELDEEPRAPRRIVSRADFQSQERERILAALQSTQWNVAEVSRMLGIPRNTLYRKLAKYALVREDHLK